MRATALLLGALLMSGEADGDDKKDPMWPVTVTVRPWITSQKMFIRPVENVKAKFVQIGKAEKSDAWRINPITALNPPQAGSEITEADGAVWVVTRLVPDASAYHICYVRRKDPPKKD